MNGLYAIEVPMEYLLDLHDFDGCIVNDSRFRIADWPHLRQNVREGDEVVLVGGVPEAPQAIVLHAIVVTLDDEAESIEVVV